MILLNRLGVRSLVDNKQMLFDLIEKYKNGLFNSHEYIVCNQLSQKIGAVLLSNPNDVNLDLSNICNLTEEEISMFSSPECRRIIISLREISKKKGWRVETVYKLIKVLHQDIINNKMNEFKNKAENLDELIRICEQGLFQDNYNLILDFIKTCLDNKLLSVNDAVNLNFYVLKESKYNKSKKVHDEELEIVELKENHDNIENIRNKIQEVFQKYGYYYDAKKMGDLDDKFVKYVDITYLEYILSKFRDYGISLNEIYLRKRALYNIIIDNDKDTFDSIIKFIDENECSLSTLLKIPAVFVKRKRNYVERVKNENGNDSSTFEISGANKDFLNNIEIYKKLANVSVIQDIDLNKIGKFLCTPSSTVNKNLLLLERYMIIDKNSLPKSIISLCGNDTEYIIDRIIEAGLYESYLSSRVNKGGEIKQPRGTYFLDGDNNPFKFYKMKRANDFGQSILASNGGIRKVFKDNSESYMGISLKNDVDGTSYIVQEPLSLEMISSMDPDIRKYLPDSIQHKIDDGRIPHDRVELLYFDNLYRYKTFSPVEIFAVSDKLSYTNLKGERIDSIFSRDYKDVITDDDIKNLTFDNFIKMLDKAIYCDSYGDSRLLKTSELTYEFSHPNFPNVNVIVSRYKVLRLCKLLKEDGSWINQNSSNIDKENTLLSVIAKDMILSEVEMMMLRTTIKKILTDGLIKVPEINGNTKNRRGAR